MFKATHKHDSFVRTLAAWPCSSFYQRMIQLQQLYTCHPSARHSQAVINDTCTNKVIGPTGDYMWWVYDEYASPRIVCGEAVQWKGGEATVCNYDTDWWRLLRHPQSQLLQPIEPANTARALEKILATPMTTPLTVQTDKNYYKRNSCCYEYDVAVVTCLFIRTSWITSFISPGTLISRTDIEMLQRQRNNSGLM